MELAEADYDVGLRGLLRDLARPAVIRCEGGGLRLPDWRVCFQFPSQLVAIFRAKCHRPKAEERERGVTKVNRTCFRKLF